MIFFKCATAIDFGGGVIGVDFESRPISEKHRAVLSELFPNVLDRAYELLDRETVLAAIIPPDSAPERVTQIDTAKPLKKRV